MMVFRHSPLETARFGLRICRASIDVVDAADLIAALQRDRVDVAILRLPAGAIGTLDGLRRHGFVPIVADTLVRYEIDLRARKSVAHHGDSLTLRAATPGDAGLLESLTREIFSGYVSHYNANPLFAPEKILDGYVEWASSHVQGGDDTTGAWLVEAAEETVGFSCYRLDRTGGLAVGVLNGVLPAVRGRGIYRGMFRRMLTQFVESGIRRFAIATQIQNIAVQRTWTAEGLSLQSAVNTVHINALRGRAATGLEPADPPANAVPGDAPSYLDSTNQC
jgi:hypothetical protein